MQALAAMSSSPFAAEDAGAFHPDIRASWWNAWPRYVNMTLALWLFASAFLWPHTRAECGASWIMGACIALNAFASIWASPVRIFDIVLGGISLLWQATAAAEHQLTLVNGVVVSGVVIAMALVPPKLVRVAKI